MDEQEISASNMGVVPGAPPPPSEVKVRTMRSDLESMARSGGGMPRFENVKISGLALGKTNTEGTEKKLGPLMIALIAAGGLIVLGVLGFFAYRAYFGAPAVPSSTNANTSTPPPASAPVTTSAPTTPSPATTTAATTTSAAPLFTHTSLFKKPVDQTITVTFPAAGAVQNAADLQSYGQRMAAALVAVKKKPSFVEVDAKSTVGQDLSAADLLAQANAPILSADFLAAHFDPDPTFFVYADKNGSWPGYVFALKPTENWLFLKNDVAKLETAPSLTNLFLSDPGSPSAAGFTDSITASTTRTLSFTGNASAQLIYGWIGNNLLISTSLQGFDMAVSRL